MVSGRIVNVPVVLQSKAAVENPQVQVLILAAHTSDTCPKTCPAVHCLRHSYILTAIPRACIGSLSIPSLLFAEHHVEVLLQPGYNGKAVQDLGWLHLDSKTQVTIECSKALVFGPSGKSEPFVWSAHKASLHCQRRADCSQGFAWAEVEPKVPLRLLQLRLEQSVILVVRSFVRKKLTRQVNIVAVTSWPCQVYPDACFPNAMRGSVGSTAVLGVVFSVHSPFGHIFAVEHGTVRGTDDSYWEEETWSSKLSEPNAAVVWMGCSTRVPTSTTLSLQSVMKFNTDYPSGYMNQCPHVPKDC